MGLDVVDDHGALELATLVGVEADVVGVLVVVERGHVQLAGGAVGRLAVVEDDRLVGAGGSGLATSGGIGATTAANEGAGAHGAHEAQTADLQELTT